VQRETGLNVHKDELRQLLTDFAAERLAILQRHEASARVVSNYDFNNAYQYVIAREETHVSWVQNALAEIGAALPAPASSLPVPEVSKSRKPDPAAFRNILEEDARTLHGFVDRWRRRVDEMTHARHRTMLNVVLGESLEHARLFEQGAAGYEDLLGRRTSLAERVGAVLPHRWME
jgi:Mn-containing catalase